MPEELLFSQVLVSRMLLSDPSRRMPMELFLQVLFSRVLLFEWFCMKMPYWLLFEQVLLSKVLLSE